MSRQGFELAKQRSNFYRDCYYIVLRWLFIEIFVIFCLIGAIMMVLFSQHTPPDYATMTGGQIVPLTPGT
jgi:hypothetical protein